MRILAALLLALLCCSCASAEPAALNTQLVSDPAIVAQCQMLGEVEGLSLWGGRLGSSLGEKQAMHSLREQAAARGGTHVLVSGTSSPLNATQATGVAYKC